MYIPGIPRRYGFGVWAWSERELADVFGSGDDVTADIVRVVRGHLGRSERRRPDDAITEPRGEPLDLRGDRIGRITRIAMWDMRVGPQRVYVAVHDRCGSARYCWPTRTNGLSGIRPAWMSRSVAASSA